MFPTAYCFFEYKYDVGLASGHSFSARARVRRTVQHH
jgi:hypothetical protein